MTSAQPRARWACVLLALLACHRKPPLAPPDAASSVAVTLPKRSHVPRIDVHTHLSPFALDRTLAMMNTWGIDHMVNLSGGAAGSQAFALQLDAARRSGGRISVFCNLDWRLARVAGYGPRMAASLDAARGLGAVGLKIPKGLGLGYTGPDGKLVKVDERELDVVWDRAGALGLPVAIHIGDPKAFWLPPNEQNERFDELRAHPEWSNYNQPIPSWQELYDGFERLVARHPKTTFIGVHFGNDPEDPDRVAKMLDKYPNLMIDTAARVPEIGRQPPEKMRAFFEKYQDRVLFGTDLGIGSEPEDLMLGSTGSTPPTDADVQRFFEMTWRYFETNDRQFDHPTPIQGRWKIDGVGLPRPVLEKIYWRNAAKLLGIALPLTGGASQK
jgi:predicted TIM-barrel fold metal-dependent hydrolase